MIGIWPFDKSVSTSSGSLFVSIFASFGECRQKTKIWMNDRFLCDCFLLLFIRLIWFDFGVSSALRWSKLIWIQNKSVAKMFFFCLVVVFSFEFSFRSDVVPNKCAGPNSAVDWLRNQYFRGSILNKGDIKKRHSQINEEKKPFNFQQTIK